MFRASTKAFRFLTRPPAPRCLDHQASQTIWGGFGGVCEFNGRGDPVVLYDQLADRWIISQFAGVSIPTDECVAVSTTGDATGSYHRYDFHLGSNFFDYPHLSVWPDGYYMSMNVFNSTGTAFLGPQPFVFDRAKMLAGLPATFITTGHHWWTIGRDLSACGSRWLNSAASRVRRRRLCNGLVLGSYRIFHFHADFATPANSTFTLFASPPAAGFTQLCALTRSCVPQAGTTSRLDGIADRLMFRVAYRNFGTHESVVGNYTVSSGGVAGIRWFELRNVTNGPVTVAQESTYQPDSTWRWMGSAAMDRDGNIAIGYSASSATIFPQLRYAGRLATDPLNVLGQGEATLFAGTGSQTGTGSRWGDYSCADCRSDRRLHVLVYESSITRRRVVSTGARGSDRSGSRLAVVEIQRRLRRQRLHRLQLRHQRQRRHRHQLRRQLRHRHQLQRRCRCRTLQAI